MAALDSAERVLAVTDKTVLSTMGNTPDGAAPPSTRAFLQDSGHHRFHSFLALLFAPSLMLTWWLLQREELSIVNFHVLNAALYGLLPILLCAAYCHWCGHWRLREGCLLSGWWLLLVGLLQWPQYLASRGHALFVDGQLKRADALLGIDVAHLASWMQAHPSLQYLSFACYVAVMPMLLVSTFLPALVGQIERAQVFLLAIFYAAFLGAIICFFLPAIGPWTAGGFIPYPDQQFYVQQLLVLRQGAPFTIDLGLSCGMITFPSFHVVCAVLSAYALWSFRYLRALLTLGVIATIWGTIATGWHYFADDLAGLALAFLAIKAAVVTTAKLQSRGAFVR